MAKKSKSNKAKSANFRPKPKAADAKPNPFELHINKVKHNVVGRKTTKSEVGRPNKARHEAFNKRKETLLSEYMKKDRKGKFVDNRIKDAQGGYAARKAKVWQMKMDPAEDLSLTHRGKIFEDGVLDDKPESDEEEMNLLGRAEYVERTHFGGGADGKAKSQAEFMDEMLEEKRRRQVEKEADLDLTDKLDSDWQVVRNLIRHKGVQRDEDEKKKEEYDMLVRELMFASGSETKPKADGTQAKVIATPTPAPSLARGKAFDEMLDTLNKTTELEKLNEILLGYVQEPEDVTHKNVYKLNEQLSVIEFAPLDQPGLITIALSAGVPHLRRKVVIKSIEMLLANRLVNLDDQSVAITTAEVVFSLTEGTFVPELVRVLQNLFVLCEPTGVHQSLFLPQIDLYKFKPEAIDTSLAAEDEEDPILTLVVRLAEIFKSVAEAYRKYPAFAEMFLDITTLLKSLVGSATELIKPFFEDCLKVVSENPQKKVGIAAKKKPFILPMLEPKLETFHNHEKRDPRRKLIKKYKREFKGAQRELRKDNSFMKTTILKETMAKDAHRKRKVKELFCDLSSQQTMFKKSKR